VGDLLEFVFHAAWIMHLCIREIGDFMIKIKHSKNVDLILIL
jgi:hypothetical protein